MQKRGEFPTSRLCFAIRFRESNLPDRGIFSILLSMPKALGSISNTTNKTKLDIKCCLLTFSKRTSNRRATYKPGIVIHACLQPYSRCAGKGRSSRTSSATHQIQDQPGLHKTFSNSNKIRQGGEMVQKEFSGIGPLLISFPRLGPCFFQRILETCQLSRHFQKLS